MKTMKSKLTILLTMALVFALTVPVMASPFQDVPANHWATDALEQVAQEGLIDGYNDGEFKGDESLTRYEVATLTAKVLNKIKAEDKEVTEETAKAVKKLATEFDKELAKVDSRLTDLETVQVTGETGVEYSDIDVDGEGVMTDDEGNEVVYKDPFNTDADGDDEEFTDDNTDDKNDTDDVTTAEDIFKQYANANVNIAQDGVQADLDLKAVNNYFGSQDDETNFELESISGQVATEDFVANIGDEQDLDWKDYLLAGEDNINGVVVNTGDSTVAVGKDDQDTKTVAAKQDNLFDLPVGIYAGAEYAQDRNVLVGADAAFNLAGIDLTGEVATSDQDLEGKLAKLGAKEELGFVALEGNYQYVTDAFAPIQQHEDFEKKTGYDVKATTELDKVALSAQHEDYDTAEAETTLAAKVAEDNAYNVYGVELFGNYEQELNSGDQVRYAEANKDLGALDLAAIYDYEDAENKSDKVLSAAYTPEFNLAGIKVAPEAKVATIYDKDNNQAVNKEAGVDASYEVNDKVTAKAGYAWADKEDRVDIAGEKVTAKAGLDYQVTEDSAATLNYEQTDFAGASDADSFTTQSVTGQVNVKF